MTRVEVVTKTTYRIDLPINSFEEILDNNMKISESDQMIIDILFEKYGVSIDMILTVNPI